MGELTIRSLPTDGSKRLAVQLKGVMPQLTCRICSSRDFALLESPDEGVRSMLVRESVSGVDPGFRIRQPLVTIVCMKCGHLEQFAEAVLNGVKPEQYGMDHTND
jgi:hypothetical protein